MDHVSGRSILECLVGPRRVGTYYVSFKARDLSRNPTTDGGRYRGGPTTDPVPSRVRNDRPTYLRSDVTEWSVVQTTSMCRRDTVVDSTPFILRTRVSDEVPSLFKGSARINGG